MTLTQTKCASCGASLQVDRSKDTVICEYCGASFVNEKAAGGQSTSNYDFVIEKGVLLEYKGSDSHVTIPGNVIVIGPKAFDHVYCLKSVVIPEHVQEVVDTAFHNCEMLTDITVNGNTGFSSTAFYGCRKLTNITLLDSIEVGVRNLGAPENAFKALYKLPEHLETDNRNVAISILNFLYGNTSRNRPVFVNGVNVSDKLSPFINSADEHDEHNDTSTKRYIMKIFYLNCATRACTKKGLTDAGKWLVGYVGENEFDIVCLAESSNYNLSDSLPEIYPGGFSWYPQDTPIAKRGYKMNICSKRQVIYTPVDYGITHELLDGEYADMLADYGKGTIVSVKCGGYDVVPVHIQYPGTKHTANAPQCWRASLLRACIYTPHTGRRPLLASRCFICRKRQAASVLLLYINAWKSQY